MRGNRGGMAAGMFEKGRQATAASKTQVRRRHDRVERARARVSEMDSGCGWRDETGKAPTGPPSGASWHPGEARRR